MSDVDAAVFDAIFDSEGSTPMLWEKGSRCDCFTTDTRQPDWNCPDCSGFGVLYAAPVEIPALFRSQGRWKSHQASGSHSLGEAALTTPVEHRPGFTDEQVRDRFTTTVAIGDQAAGRVFYPAAQAVPFLFDGEQQAWRVQLQSAEQNTRVKRQP